MHRVAAGVVFAAASFTVLFCLFQRYLRVREVREQRAAEAAAAERAAAEVESPARFVLVEQPGGTQEVGLELADRSVASAKY